MSPSAGVWQTVQVFDSTFCVCVYVLSAEPDPRGSTWHHQGACWRPAGRYRVPDPGHDHAVHLQGKLPHPGSDTSKHRPRKL